MVPGLIRQDFKTTALSILATILANFDLLLKFLKWFYHWRKFHHQVSIWCFVIQKVKGFPLTQKSPKIAQLFYGPITAWLRRFFRWRSFLWYIFFFIRTEYRKILTRKKSVFGHFSRSVTNSKPYFDQDKSNGKQYL